MTASVQDIRLARRFELWDADGDGAVDRSDLETEARRILRAFGEREGAPRGRARAALRVRAWMRRMGLLLGLARQFRLLTRPASQSLAVLLFLGEKLL